MKCERGEEKNSHSLRDREIADFINDDKVRFVNPTHSCGTFKRNLLSFEDVHDGVHSSEKDFVAQFEGSDDHSKGKMRFAVTWGSNQESLDKALQTL